MGKSQNIRLSNQSNKIDALVKSFKDRADLSFHGTTQADNEGKLCEGFKIRVDKNQRKLWQKAGYTLDVCYDSSVKWNGVFRLTGEHDSRVKQGEGNEQSSQSPMNDYAARFNVSDQEVRQSELARKKALIQIDRLSETVLGHYMELRYKLKGKSCSMQNVWAPRPEYEQILDTKLPPEKFVKIPYEENGRKTFIFVRNYGRDVSIIRDLLADPIFEPVTDSVSDPILDPVREDGGVDAGDFRE